METKKIRKVKRRILKSLIKKKLCLTWVEANPKERVL
jgi:hypothetical protein